MRGDLLEILEFFERFEKAGTLNKKYSEIIRNLYKEKEYYKKLYNESNDWLFDYEEFKESKHIPRID